MLNINELEKRHAKYKLKSYLPYIIASISIVLIIIFFLNIIDFQDNKETNIIKDKIIKAYPLKKIKNIDNNKTKKEIQKKIIISPSFNFMNKIKQTTAIPYYKKRETIPTKKIKKENKKITKKRVILEDKIVLIEKKAQPTLTIKKKSILKIKRNKQDDDIQHVIKRFKVNNKPALSLFVAKKYYQMGKYKKSYNYALITNQINSNIEASWIIFAKSLMKLNEQKMAIKTLKKYIDESHSSRAKILLDEIQSGKFK